MNNKGIKLGVSELPESIRDMFKGHESVVISVSDKEDADQPNYGYTLFGLADCNFDDSNKDYRTVMMARDGLYKLADMAKNGRVVNVENVLVLVDVLEFAMGNIANSPVISSILREPECTYSEYVRKIDRMIREELSDDTRDLLTALDDIKMNKCEPCIVTSAFHYNLGYKDGEYLIMEDYSDGAVPLNMELYMEICLELNGFIWFKPLDDYFVFMNTLELVFTHSYAECKELLSLWYKHVENNLVGNVLRNMYDSNLSAYLNDCQEYAGIVINVDGDKVETVNRYSDFF